MSAAAGNLLEAARDARRILRSAAARGFEPLDDFVPRADAVLDALCSDASGGADFAFAVAETIPRLFAADVSTGYAFFYDPDRLSKIWGLYNKAAAFVTASVKAPKYSPSGRGRRAKILCLSGVFADCIAPSKAMANFARNLDGNLFEPVFISTNQFDTMRREGTLSVEAQKNSVLGKMLAESGVPFLSIPEQDNVLALAEKLISVCAEYNFDIVVSNASPFSFPDACLAASGAAGSFFDMHQGFPLHADGVDAILHWNPQSEARQLGLWKARGGMVISYKFGLDLLDIPSFPEKSGDIVLLVTASNYLERRLSPEFCAVADRILREFPRVHYKLVGSCDKNVILSKFSPEAAQKIHFAGGIADEVVLMAHLLNADIYLNEFPIGGGRSALEAMEAGLPVMAMRCGDSHVETVAADHVGEFAIPEYSPDKYYSRLRELVLSPEKRKAEGAAMRQRLVSIYDNRVIVRDLSLRLLAEFEKKHSLPPLGK